MDLPDKEDIPRRSDGIYRSAPLPRVAGTKVELPSQINESNNLRLWQHRINDPNQIIAIDLFSGAGGMSHGFEQAGFFIAAGIDHDESSVMTHAHNFISKSVQKDISEIAEPKELLHELGIPRVDVIIGGPPCQGFSRVGRGKLRSVALEEYYTSVINELYREFIRFVAELQPLAFVMENVPDMATFNDGELLRKIENTFENQLDYRISHTILDAVNYGVPQRRKRLFIQGNRIGSSIQWPAPRLTEREIITVKDAIGDMPCRLPPSTDEVLPYHCDDPSEYQKLMRANMPEDQQDLVYDHIIRAVRDDDKVIFSLMQEGDRYCDIPEEFQRYRRDIFKDKYWKLYWNEPCWTVTAHIRKDSYRYIHPDPDQGRMLSIREFARLQSFPDRFRFCGPPTRRMQQIGNAVPSLLAESIAKELYKQICQYKDSETYPETNITVAKSPDGQNV